MRAEIVDGDRGARGGRGEEVGKAAGDRPVSRRGKWARVEVEICWEDVSRRNRVQIDCRNRHGWEKISKLEALEVDDWGEMRF